VGYTSSSRLAGDDLLALALQLRDGFRATAENRLVARIEDAPDPEFLVPTGRAHQG